MSMYRLRHLLGTIRAQLGRLATICAMLVLAPILPPVAHAQAPNSNASRASEPHPFFTPEIMRKRGMPLGGAHTGAASNQTSPGGQGENASQGPLLYGGGPVMRDPTNYVIIWNPPGATFSATYQQLIEQYFKDIGDTPFMEINSQYGDSSGDPVPNTNHFGGTWIDTTAYPQAGTVADPLVGGDIQASVNRAIAANPTWQAPGLNTMYFVYLGQNIIECFKGSANKYGCFAGTDSGGNSPPASNGPPNSVLGAGTYCAYHYFFGAGPRIYANMPYASLGACYPTPNLVGYPNGSDADVVLSPTSHEQFEAYSDPLIDAWADAGGNENGDKCAYTYGQVEPDGTNFVLWGRRYQLQEQWSNALTYGCVKRAGPAPQLAVTGDLNFGTVPRGSTATKEILIQNTASGDLNLLNARLSAASSAFSIDPASPRWATVLTGENVLLKVNFSPSANAATSSVPSNSLVLDTDQIGFETQSIASSASIGLPKAALSGSLNFGTVCTSTPADQFLTVTNTGDAPLTISSVTIRASSTPGLSVLPNPSLPRTLPIGGSLIFTVRFTAGAIGGSITGFVDVVTDDPVSSTLSLAVTGTTGAANATISSSALDFGGVATDNRTAPYFADRTVTIGNTGTCALNVTSLGPISGTNPGDFSIIGAPTLPVSIGAASSLTLTIRFNPSAPGTRTASLAIGTTDPITPGRSVALSGTGLIPAILTSAAALNYAPTVIQSQAPGYPGSLQNLTVTNVGQAELIVDSMTTAPPFSAPGATNPPARFAPSDNYNEPITFAPTAVGKFVGAFTVSDNNAEGPVSMNVSLCGEGVQRGIRVLAVAANGTPFAQIAKLHLQSKGTAQGVNENVQNLTLTGVPTSCDPNAKRQYENQSLPATDTLNQRSSYYTLAVTAGGKSTTITFTLGVAEFKTLVVTIK